METAWNGIELKNAGGKYTKIGYNSVEIVVSIIRLRMYRVLNDLYKKDLPWSVRVVSVSVRVLVQEW